MAEKKPPVLTLVNNLPNRVEVTVHLPKEYCLSTGYLLAVNPETLKENPPLVSFEGEGLWYLNAIRRSDNGIKVTIEGILKDK